jgi:hypothetical protein
MRHVAQNRLLKVSGDMVEVVNRSDFIGGGDELARATASWLFHPMLPRKVAGQIALQVLHWTTQHAQFCGKGIHAMGIPNPWQPEHSVAIYEITEFFWGLNDLLRPILIGCIDIGVPSDQLDSSLRAFQAKMLAVREANVRAAAPYPGLSPSSVTEPGQPS